MAHGPMKEVHTELFGYCDEYENFTFGAGAQFIVSKEQIQKRPKEFYAQIIRMLGDSINPMEGFPIERFHHKILTCG
jgi:Protein of unknown function (DUF3431)